MLKEKDRNVISEIFNICFSKSISRFSLLIDDRLDISVPKIINFNKSNFKNIFGSSNLIFNDFKSMISILKGDLNGEAAFIIEHNNHEAISNIDIDSINKVFNETITSSLESILDSNIIFNISKQFDNMHDFFDYTEKSNINEAGKYIIHSRWSTRNNNLCGYIFVIAELNMLMTLPKFKSLLEIS